MFLQQPLAFENRTDEDGAPVKNSKCSGLQIKHFGVRILSRVQDRNLLEKAARYKKVDCTAKNRSQN